MNERTVVFPNRRGRTIVGTLLIPEAEGGSPAALVIHGFRGNRNGRHVLAVADALAWAGFVSLRVDLTDNLGDADGDFRDLTVTQELDDARDALEYLGNLSEVDPARMGITGHSLGGLVAAVTAARVSSLKSLVTLSAVFNMAEKFPGFLGEEQVRAWQERGHIEMDPPGSGLFLGYGFYADLLRLDVAQEVGQLRAPCRIIQGEADIGVTTQDAQLYYQHIASTEKDLALIPGADHVYSNDAHLMQVCLYTADWFRRHLLAS